MRNSVRVVDRGRDIELFWHTRVIRAMNKNTGSIAGFFKKTTILKQYSIIFICNKKIQSTEKAYHYFRLSVGWLSEFFLLSSLVNSSQILIAHDLEHQGRILENTNSYNRSLNVRIPVWQVTGNIYRSKRNSKLIYFHTNKKIIQAHIFHFISETYRMDHGSAITIRKDFILRASWRPLFSSDM